jgi:hypothetical protein
MITDMNCCHHEACHAVVAKRVGLRVKYATVAPERPHVRLLTHVNDPHGEAKNAVVALAGTIDDPSESARAFDEQHAFARCQRIAMDHGKHGEEFDGLHEAATAELEQLRSLARYLVAANADIIERVAHALSRKITLDEAQIDALVPDAE